MIFSTFVLIVLTMGCSSNIPLSSQQASPIGIWKIVDNETGRERLFVEIWKDNDTLSGKVLKMPDKPNEGKDEKCYKCPGDKKNQPIVGMTIMWDLKKKDDKDWYYGKFLGPYSGAIYKCYLDLQAGGKKLKVRAFLGLSLLGSTEFWYRYDAK